MDTEKAKKWGLSFLKYVGALLAGIIVPALIKGEPLKGLTSMGSFLRFLGVHVGIPVWLILILLVLVVAGISYLVSLRQRVAQVEWEAAKAAAVKSLESSKPVLHVSWERQQCVWGRGTIGTEPAMQLIGWAMVSTSGNEPIILREAYIKGTEPVLNCMDVLIKPGVVTRKLITTFVRPIIVKDDEDLRTAVILRDHQNREYITPEVTFRAIGSPTQPKISPPIVETPK